MDQVHSLLIMLAIVAGSGLVAHMFPRVPLPLLQIAAGTLAACPSYGLQVELDPQIFMLLFIPPMLFADAWHMPQREFHAYRWQILLLSTLMVFGTVVGLGYFVHWVLPVMPLSVCFLLAAVLAPTDAVAVSAMLRGARLPSKLQHILEGEALTNDAAALVAVKFAIAATLAQHVTLAKVMGNFVGVAIGGALVGVVFSLLFALLYGWLARRQEPESFASRMLLLAIMPFGPYLIAEHLHLSGVMAAVAAGVTASTLHVRRGVFDALQVQSREAWTTVRFALNGLVFTLIGLQLPRLVRSLPSPLDGTGHMGLHRAHPVLLALAITVVLLVLRFLALAALSGFENWCLHRRSRARRAEQSQLWLWAALGAVGGTRGGITLAAVLGVPLLTLDGSLFPGRGLLVFQASMVIVFSLLLASVGLPWLLSRLALTDPDSTSGAQARARSLATRAALRAIDSEPMPLMLELSNDDNFGGADAWQNAISRVRERTVGIYRNRAAAFERQNGDVHCQRMRQEWDAERMLLLRGLQAERTELQRLRLRHRINDETLRTLVHEIDVIEVALRSSPVPRH